VVVHVEPQRHGDLRDRVLAAALAPALVREAHDITIFDHPDGALVSLHLKLPAALSIADAHQVAERVEREIRADPEVRDVQTHLEPLERPLAVDPHNAPDEQAIGKFAEFVRARTGRAPVDLRLLQTDAGLVVFVTVATPATASLTDAHTLASRLEDDIRTADPGIADVVVHTEPVVSDRVEETSGER
jgi:divalent metal cation (Fe/Co/Zn/Cd) transporter